MPAGAAARISFGHSLFFMQHILITGASSGLGAEFARQLAPAARSLALVARRAELLEELAAELRAKHPGLSVIAISCDLADPAARAALPVRCDTAGFSPTCLINNAGMGDYGEFDRARWDKTDLMLQVNIAALTHLTHLFLPALKANAPGGILNVSSLAGELPIPDFAVYAATKAYVTRFSEALRMELREHRIAVTALCPGPVKTGFGAAAERDGERIPTAKRAYVTAEQVVRTGLRALAEGKPKAFPGFVVSVTARLINSLPGPVLRAILSRRPRRSRSRTPSS